MADRNPSRHRCEARFLTLVAGSQFTIVDLTAADYQRSIVLISTYTPISGLGSLTPRSSPSLNASASTPSPRSTIVTSQSFAPHTATPSNSFPDAALPMLEEARLCALVIVGVRTDGTKELVAITDGHRESTESWADLLRDLKRRGMRAPMVAVGDGALGFWAALRTVWPATIEQRCWVHKVANCLNALPKSVQPTARKLLAEIRDAEDREHAVTAINAFANEFAVKWPKAVAKIVDDAEPLLAFYDFPAEHWIHLKTTNPIESTFATVRLRTKVTKGPGSKAAGLAMAFKLIEAAETRWRSVNAPQLVALVRAGVKFEKGVMVERTDKQDQEAAA